MTAGVAVKRKSRSRRSWAKVENDAQVIWSVALDLGELRELSECILFAIPILVAILIVFWSLDWMHKCPNETYVLTWYPIKSVQLSRSWLGIPSIF